MTTTTPNTPATSVNAWTLIGEDNPSGTGYTSSNSSYQSMVNNNTYRNTDMLFACFFVVVPDGNNYFTIEIGNMNQVHPDGSTPEFRCENAGQRPRALSSRVALDRWEAMHTGYLPAAHEYAAALPLRCIAREEEGQLPELSCRIQEPLVKSCRCFSINC